MWATKKYGRVPAISSWRKALNQNWALYRRRLLKRTRSQTPPMGVLTADSLMVGDQVPLIVSDRMESVSPAGAANEGSATTTHHLDLLRSVTSSGGGVLDNHGMDRRAAGSSQVGVRIFSCLRN